MKKVCPKCGSNRLHKHGKKRRKCAVCGNLRKYYIYKYAKLVLDSTSEEQKQFRLKHFTKTINLMWTPMASNEINVIKSFIRNLKNAFTFLEYQEVWDNISKTTNQN